jgi:hypothetical protein
MYEAHDVLEKQISNLWHERTIMTQSSLYRLADLRRAGYEDIQERERSYINYTEVSSKLRGVVKKNRWYHSMRIVKTAYVCVALIVYMLL